MTRTMNVVAVDTSTDMLACAVARVRPDGGPDGVQVLASGDHLCRRRANIELVPTIDAALAQAGLARADVDAVVVGVGPGSFTGVRIGVAAAKGLACGLGVGCHAVSTLDAMAWEAWRAGARGTVGVVGDAMRKEVYPGLYRVDDRGARRMFASETVLRADRLAAQWAGAVDPCATTLAGDGLVKYAGMLEEAGFSARVGEGHWFPSGESLLLAAVDSEVLADGSSADPALVLPVYTRLSDAEENERARLGMPEPASARVTGVAELLGDAHRQLRPMGVNDLGAVAGLEAAAYPKGEGHDAWTKAMFSDEYCRAGSSWWIAHDQGRVVAFAGGAVVDGNLEVLDVVVDPSARGEGLAKRLLARVSYDAQMLGARTASLEVDVANAPALALYAKLGFTRDGVRRDYYGRGRDAATMSAALPLSYDPAGPAVEPSGCGRSWPRPLPARTDAGRAAIEAAGPLILAIESSCDETAAAVIDGAGEIVANVVATQIDFHARFGGVVPEIASRKHIEAIVGVYEEAMAQAAASLGVEGLLPSDLAAVACTQGPGLVGALVVGLSFSKALAWSADVPLICVNHLEGHLFANLFQTPDLAPPFVASLLSGGHTMLVLVRDWGDYEVLGQTLDDAVGEAFDKVAKALGLGYPGGPVISRLAASGNPRAIDFPRAMMRSGDYRFSLSGLKTAVVTYIEQRAAAGRGVDVEDLAASFQAAVIDVQVSKALAAVREHGVRDFCAGGGVTANPALRRAFQDAFERRGVRVTVPPPEACTDNAAMIALVARRLFDAGSLSPLSADADPSLSL